MLKVSWWEEFILGATVSFLTVLVPKMKNPAEVVALQSAIAFLQQLLNGQVSVVQPGQ